MQTRRDQLDAHKYLVQRLNSALVDAEPDAPESPPRRDAKTVIGTVLAGVLAIVVVGLYAALFSGGSTAWKQPSTVIVNKDDGSRYLLVDGMLHPIRSISAARLLIGGPVKIQTASAKALAKTPVGPPLGVPGTPDNLPTPSTIAESDWSVCSAPAPADMTVVGIGPERADKSPALLVTDGSGTWLLYDGSRHLLAVPWAADAAGVSSVPPARVAPSWLSLLPVGDPVEPPLVAGRGGLGPTINGVGTSVGQLLVAGSTSYLVVENGIVALTSLQVALVRGDPTVPQPLQVPESATAALSRMTLPVSENPLPQQPVQVPSLSAGETPCLVAKTSATSAPTYDLFVQAHDVPLQQDPDAAPTGEGASMTGKAVAVLVAPGHGALVSPEKVILPRFATNQSSLSDVYLVTDTGQAYPVGTVAALNSLGFDIEDVQILPTTFVNQLVRGPALR